MSTCGDIKRGFGTAGNTALNTIAKPCRVFTGWDCFALLIEGTKAAAEAVAALAQQCAAALTGAGISCAQTALEAINTCKDKAAHAYQKCSDFADWMANKCNEYAEEICEWVGGFEEVCEDLGAYDQVCEDQGHKECCDWKPCKWFCKAYRWVAKWVCKAGVWIANKVCKAGAWIADKTCKLVKNTVKAACWLSVAAIKVACYATSLAAVLACAAVGSLVAGTCLAAAYLLAATCYIAAAAVEVALVAAAVFASQACIYYELARLGCLGFAHSVDKGLKLIGSITAEGCWAFYPKEMPQNKIKHVIVLVLENRSFDHMLGNSGIAGIDGLPNQKRLGSDGLPDPEPNITVQGNDPANVISSFPVGTTASFKVQFDPPHEFEDVREALCGLPPDGGYVSGPHGNYPIVTNKDALSAYQRIHDTTLTESIQCFEPEQVPVLVQLASEFAVCDNWFASVPGPTWPNRCFFHAASSAGLDHSPLKDTVSYYSSIDGITFNNGTIFDAVAAEKLTWGVYGTLQSQITALHGIDIPDVHGYSILGAQLASGNVPNYVFIEPDYGNMLVGGGDYICGTSQHPKDDVTRGEKFIRHLYRAVRNSPIWESCALVITYDEHGGFFDHVSPPETIPPGDGNTNPKANVHGFDFRQLGARVPAVIISPWIPKSTVNHARQEHSSLVATVGKLFDFSPLTDRDKHENALPFDHLFSLDTPRSDAPPKLAEAAVSGITCSGDLPLGLEDDPFSFGFVSELADLGIVAGNLPTSSFNAGGINWPATTHVMGSTAARVVNDGLHAGRSAARSAQLRTTLTQTPSPGLMPWVQVFLKADLKYAPPHQRARLIEQVTSIRTEGDVKAYIGESIERLLPQHLARNAKVLRRETRIAVKRMRASGGNGDIPRALEETQNRPEPPVKPYEESVRDSRKI